MGDLIAVVIALMVGVAFLFCCFWLIRQLFGVLNAQTALQERMVRLLTEMRDHEKPGT